MKPALLNAIYHKLSQHSETLSPSDAITNYAQKVFVLYVTLLEKHHIENLNQIVEVTTKLEDGSIMKNKFKAGHYMIEFLLTSEDNKHEIEVLDKEFYSHCLLPNAQDILDDVKHVLMEVGSETLDTDEWTKAINGLEEKEQEESV